MEKLTSFSKGVKVLSKQQLLNTVGGVDHNTTRNNIRDPQTGGCAVLDSNGTVHYGLTSSQASGWGGVRWCCDSCGSASWY